MKTLFIYVELSETLSPRAELNISEGILRVISERPGILNIDYEIMEV